MQKVIYMQQFDIIGAWRTYATNIIRGWVFLAGDKFHQNYEASKYTFTPDQIILSCFFRAGVVYNESNGINNITYTGTIALGRKIDDNTNPTPDTVSSLDETFIQKYDNRLLELSQLLASTLKDFSCTNQLSITSCNMDMFLNRYDENIDFVEAQITFDQR